MSRNKNYFRRELFIKIERALLIGGVSAIIFQDVPVVQAQSADDTLVADIPTSAKQTSAQVVTVPAPGLDAPAPSLENPGSIVSPDGAIDLRPFPEVIGDPKTDKVVLFNRGENHGLNLDPDSIRAYEQIAAIYADQYTLQGTPWKNIKLNYYDNESSVDNTFALSPLHVPEYFIDYGDGQRSGIGAATYGGYHISQSSKEIILDITLNNNADKVLYGPLFDNSSEVSAVVKKDDDEMAQYRRDYISRQIGLMIGALIEYNVPDPAMWPNAPDDKGIYKTVYNPDILNLVSNFPLQIV